MIHRSLCWKEVIKWPTTIHSFYTTAGRISSQKWIIQQCKRIKLPKISQSEWRLPFWVEFHQKIVKSLCCGWGWLTKLKQLDILVYFMTAIHRWKHLTVMSRTIVLNLFLHANTVLWSIPQLFERVIGKCKRFLFMHSYRYTALRWENVMNQPRFNDRALGFRSPHGLQGHPAATSPNDF